MKYFKWIKSFWFCIFVCFFFSFECYTAFLKHEYNPQEYFPKYDYYMSLTDDPVLLEFISGSFYYSWYLDHYNQDKSLFLIFPYLILFLLSFWKVYADWFDRLLTLNFMASAIKNWLDWNMNYNTDDTKTDWLIFGSIALLLVILKISYYALFTRKQY